MVAIKIKVDTRALAKFKALPDEFKRKAMKRVGQEFILSVVEDVNKGIDINGRAFKPYDPKYGNKKERAGRMGENFWLRLTGKMINSMSATSDKNRTVVLFRGQRPSVSFRNPSRAKKKKRGGKLTVSTKTSRSVSNALIAWVNNQKRHFFGINKKRVRRMRDAFMRALRVFSRRSRK